MSEDYSNKDAAEKVRRWQMRQSGMPTEGDMVTWDGGAGAVEYVMVDGTLGEYGGEYALEAQDDDPVALVRVFRSGAPTEYMIGKMLSELTVAKKSS